MATNRFNKSNMTPLLQSKKQRIRANPVKKWDLYEEKLLIEYLLQHRENIERPTAQVFYKIFCQIKKINVEWQLVRSKVRNMRISYFKTRSALEASAEEGEGDRTVRKCNFYNELDMIFSHRYTKAYIPFENTSSEDFNLQLDIDDTSTAASEKSDIEIVQTSNNHNGMFKRSPSHQTDLMQIESVCSVEKIFVPEIQNQDLERDVIITENNSKLENRRSDIDILPTSSTNRKRCFRRSPPPQPDLMQIESVCSAEESFVSERQNADLNIEERKLIIKEKELQLEERRLQLKEKKLISEENIKIHKINSREKLKIKELEMKERLALEELKLKYK